MHQITKLSKLKPWPIKALLLNNQPTKALSLKRYIPATVALLAGVSLSVVAGLMVRNWEGERMEIQFQVSNDGLAFRYVFPEQDGTLRRIRSEASSFNFLPETRAWLQPVAVAKSSWGSANPSYEEIYQADFRVGMPSPCTGTALKRCSWALKPMVLALARLFALPACCMKTCLAPVIAV